MKYLKWSKALMFACLLGLTIGFSGCLKLPDAEFGSPSKSSEATQKETADSSKTNNSSTANNSTSSSSTAKSKDNVDNKFNGFLDGHELALAGNPVLGSYRTTSGCKVEFKEDGSYRWEESDVFLLGRYEIYEGTPTPGGAEEYTYKSDTGSIYTIVVYYDDPEDLAPNQVVPASEISIFVYDTYTTDVFRVTDLMNNLWFEATAIIQ
jgi:hypothetical protein